MTSTYKLTARTVSQTPIATFELAEGEDLDTRVASEIDKAIETKSLDGLATRVGLPAIAASRVEEGESLNGGENVVAHHLYAPDGSPLAERDYRIEAAGGGAALFAVVDEHDEEPIGVFADSEVAEQVGLLWKNGHIALPTTA